MLKCRQVPKLYLCFQDKDHLYYVMEYCGGGSLDEYVKSQGDTQLSLDEVRILVAEIVLALEAINSFGVCHRDFKLQNLIFDTEGHLKLVDFGSAKIYEKTELNSLQYDRIKKVLAEYEKKYLVSQPIESDYGADEYESWDTPKEPRELVGSALYAAPEMIINGYSDFETDYWALGIILYRLIFGRYPFDETSTSQEALFKKICNNGLDFPPTSTPAAEAAKDLIRKLLTRDPKKRMGCSKKADSGLTFADLKAHAFFKEVDFHKIYDIKGMKVIKSSLATPNQYGNGVRSHDNSQNNTVSSSFNSSHCNSTLGKKTKEVMAQVQTKRKKFLFIDVVGTLIIFSDATIRYDQIYDNSTRTFKLRHLKKVDFNAKTMNIYLENDLNNKTYDLKTFDKFAEAYAEVLATIPKDDEMAED